MLFTTLGPSSLPVMVAQHSLTKDMQTEPLLCWSGRTDTEHSLTSGLNEVVVYLTDSFNGTVSTTPLHLQSFSIYRV